MCSAGPKGLPKIYQRELGISSYYCQQTVRILGRPSAWPYIQASVQQHLWVSLLECNFNHCGGPTCTQSLGALHTVGDHFQSISLSLLLQEEYMWTLSCCTAYQQCFIGNLGFPTPKLKFPLPLKLLLYAYITFPP